MTTRILTFIIALISLFVFSVMGQLQTKRVQFEKNERVEELSAAQNYVSVKVARENSPRNVAHLFDKRGDKIMEKVAEDGGWIRQSEPLESLGYFLIIEPGYEATEGTPGKDGKISAYDIKSGAEIWSLRMNAYRYRISPDGMRLVTQSPAITGGSGVGRFTVVNLKDGSVVAQRLDVQAWYADWFDNERIVVGVQQLVKDPSAESSQQERVKRNSELTGKRDSLIHQRLRITTDVKIGRTTKDEGQKRMAQINAEIDSLSREIRAGKSRRPHAFPSVRIPGRTKLMLYNIRTNGIELEKELFTAEGTPITVDATSDNPVGTINVERATQNIYLLAYKGKPHPASRCLVMVDRAFKISNTVPLGGLSLQKVIVGEEIYFIAKGKAGTFLVNMESGLELAQGTLATGQGSIEIDLHSKMSEMRIITNVKVAEDGNSIEFAY